MVMYRKKYSDEYVDLSKVTSYKSGYKHELGYGGPRYTLVGVTENGQNIVLDEFVKTEDLTLAMRSLAVQLSCNNPSLVTHYGSKCISLTERVENEQLSMPESLEYVGKLNISMDGRVDSVTNVYLDKHNDKCYYHDKETGRWYNQAEMAIYGIEYIDRRLADSLNKCIGL